MIRDEVHNKACVLPAYENANRAPVEDCPQSIVLIKKKKKTGPNGTLVIYSCIDFSLFFIYISNQGKTAQEPPKDKMKSWNTGEQRQLAMLPPGSAAICVI